MRPEGNKFQRLKPWLIQRSPLPSAVALLLKAAQSGVGIARNAEIEGALFFEARYVRP
jgi:hypothetical protein